MDRDAFEQKAAQYLHTLCEQIPDRRLGSEGNRQATAFFGETLKDLGCRVTFQSFDCLDWVDEGASLIVAEHEFEVMSSPYSLECEITAPLVLAASVDELKELQAEGSILLLLGEIAQEQLMPKKFPFYNPEHHKEIYALLESKSPLAIITATSRNPELAGGMYPFPMIEDGDFNIPSVYMKDVEGERLTAYMGQEISLSISTTRLPARGENVLGRIGPDTAEKIVLCAHIDAKENTPGALDNGTGVVMLLILAELLVGYSGKYQIELLAFNGEDHYSAQGHKEYIKENEDHFNKIMLAINTDVAGFIEGNSAYSLYGCTPEVETIIREAMSGYKSLVEGEQWFQSDHSIFIQQGRPAMAITSDRFMELSTHITHTPKDNIDLVDFSKLIDISFSLRDVVDSLNQLE
jgi:aminopeptidase YwaD